VDKPAAPLPATTQPEAKANGAKSAMIVKISVLSNGDLLDDGHKVNIEQLAAHMPRVKAANGMVWYYREAAGYEPPAIAMQVMKLVVDNRLPIAMSSKPDFSDCVDITAQARSKKPE
jgi:hypothetical protein